MHPNWKELLWALGVVPKGPSEIVSLEQPGSFGPTSQCAPTEAPGDTACVQCLLLSAACSILHLSRALLINVTFVRDFCGTAHKRGDGW